MKKKPIERLDIYKDIFIKHKEDYKTFLKKRTFDIAVHRWEYETSIKDISHKYGISATRIRQILAVAIEKITERGYDIKEWK